MRRVLLAPHNLGDDETLFASFVCQRSHPLVIVCLRSFVQEKVYGITHQTREAETECAMKILGCEWEQWDIRDDDPDWDEMEKRLRALDVEHVWAPALEKWVGGHAHHDAISRLATRIFPGQVSYYTTYYRPHHRSLGAEIRPEPEWVLRKLQAMACYESQITGDYPVHWLDGLREYERS